MPLTAAPPRAAITLTPVQVRTGSQDTVGRLAFADGELVAVLVRLDDLVHDAGLHGGWYLEAGFGPVAAVFAPTFGDLDAATAWIGRQLGPH